MSQHAPPETVWNLDEHAPREFRDEVWRLLGQSRKRDVFLAVCDLAGDGEPLEQAMIAREAVKGPHFDDDAKPDLGDNGDLVAMENLLAGYPVPWAARPSYSYFLPFEPMCEYMVDPFHMPTSTAVQAAIQYLRFNDPPTAAERREADRDEEKLPIEPFATEGRTFVEIAQFLDCVAPKLEFSEFRPDDYGGHVGQGVVVAGDLYAEEMAFAEGHTDSELKEALHHLFARFTEHVAHGKNIFQIGLYQDDDDRDRQAVRREAIADKAGFEVFDPDPATGHFEFRWQTEPVIVG